jgi:hypothetical protein
MLGHGFTHTINEVLRRHRELFADMIDVVSNKALGYPLTIWIIPPQVVSTRIPECD